MDAAQRFEARHLAVITAAEALIAQKGVLHFTIKDVAKKAGVSVGSIYTHVRSKEELLFTVAISYLEKKNQLFHAIASLDLPDYLKMLAFLLYGYENNRTNPLILQVFQMASLPPVRASCSEERRGRFDSLTQETLDIIRASVRPFKRLDDLITTIWSLLEGIQRLLQLSEFGVIPLETLPNYDNPTVHAGILAINDAYGARLTQSDIERVFSFNINI